MLHYFAFNFKLTLGSNCLFIIGCLSVLKSDLLGIDLITELWGFDVS